MPRFFSINSGRCRILSSNASNRSSDCSLACFMVVVLPDSPCSGQLTRLIRSEYRYTICTTCLVRPSAAISAAICLPHERPTHEALAMKRTPQKPAPFRSLCLNCSHDGSNCTRIRPRGVLTGRYFLAVTKQLASSYTSHRHPTSPFKKPLIASTLRRRSVASGCTEGTASGTPAQPRDRGTLQGFGGKLSDANSIEPHSEG
jgi:hypothetical protein